MQMITNKNKIEQNETMTKERGRREYMRNYMKQRRNVNNFLVNISDLSEVKRDFYEERAAIMEFDGGMCRANAEIEAAKLTLIFFGKTELN
jgi:hypothetical protein